MTVDADRRDLARLMRDGLRKLRTMPLREWLDLMIGCLETWRDTLDREKNKET